MKIPEMGEFDNASDDGIVAVELILFVDEMFGIFEPPIAVKKAHPTDNVIM